MKIYINAFIVICVAACTTRHTSSGPSQLVDAGHSSADVTTNTIGMDPEAFSSGVPINTALLFRVDVAPAVAKADVEKSIVVRAAGGGIVNGVYGWKASQVLNDTSSTLTFIPQTSLTKATDYLVSVTPTGSFAPAHALAAHLKAGPDGVFRAGFTTGNHLRLSTIKVVSKDGSNVNYLRFGFSEPADLRSILDALSVTQGGTVIAGEFVDPLPKYLELNTPTKEYQYNFSTPPSLNGTLTFGLVQGVKTPNGDLLDPSSLGSIAAPSGSISVDLNATKLNQLNHATWLWRPTLLQ